MKGIPVSALSSEFCTVQVLEVGVWGEMGPSALPQKCEINDFLSICLLSAHSVADSSKAILFFTVRMTLEA